MTTHTVKTYTRELEDLRSSLVLMAGRVEAMISGAVRAVSEADPELAREIKRQDKAVNRDELEIDARCMELLARWQPMASDLRFVTLTLKMVTDLERIGDLAVNCCERVIDMAAQPPGPPSQIMDQLGAQVQGMAHEAIEAFLKGDIAQARRVLDRDDVVDDLYKALFREQLQVMDQDRALVERSIQLQSVAKYLERIGDHCTNLAEQVIFLVGGEDIRHPKSRIASA